MKWKRCRKETRLEIARANAAIAYSKVRKNVSKVFPRSLITNQVPTVLPGPRTERNNRQCMEGGYSPNNKTIGYALDAW